MRVLMTMDAVGGVWNYSLQLIKALGDRNVSVLLVVLGPQPSHSQRMEVDALTNVERIFLDCKLEWMDEPWHDVHKTSQRLTAVAQDYGPDVVHLNSYSYAFASWPAPVIVVAHSCVLSWWRAVMRTDPPSSCEPYRQHVTRGLNAADLIIAPSRTMLSALHQHYVFGSDETVIPNGVRTDAFQPTAKQKFILAVGRIWDDAKNLKVLDQVSERLKWPIWIAGDTHLPGVDAWPSAAGKTHKLGRLSSAELSGLMSAAPIYVHPAKYEPFGLSVLEAAISGCALVLGDIESLRENWDGAALFVPPDNDAALAESIEQLVERADLRSVYGKRARARAVRFDSSVMAARYFEVYQSLANNRKIRPLEHKSHPVQCVS